MGSFALAACGGNTVSDPEGGAGSATVGGSAAVGGSTAAGGAASKATGGAGTGGALVEGSVCDPLDDACSPGNYCQWRDGRAECIPEGSTKRDENCEETGACERGSICLSAGEFAGKTCQQPCPLDEGLMNVCDIGRHTCFVALDDEDRELHFGVCRY